MRFIVELKQRKVFQWTLAYAAGAFAALQVLDIVAQQFAWSTDTQRAITLILGLGVFVVLTLAWYHGEQGAQRVGGVELLILALLFGIGGGTVALLAPNESVTSNAGTIEIEPQPDEHPSAPIRSIAVLPLDNYSGDPGQEYFAEGMTDQLTAELAAISTLRVISRGSANQFKGSQRVSTPEIARILKVDALIEGSVLRFGDKVRITAQLIDARVDKHLWAKSFDGVSADVLALQDELASAIAREIDIQLTPSETSRLTSAPRVIPAAYDAYLQGRYFMNRPSDENLSKAITQFERAVLLDPDFAPAYSGLSDAYLWAGFNESVYSASEARPRAKAAAERGVELDPDSAEARTSLAIFKFFYEYNWEESEAEFREVFRRNPNYSYAHDQFALMLAFQSRFTESIAESKLAAELDPLSPQIPIDAIFAYTWQGEYAQAKQLVERAAYLDPEFFFVPWSYGWIELQAGNVVEAIQHLERARSLESPVFVLAWLGYAKGASGDRVGALEALAVLNANSLSGYVSPFYLALAHLGLGDQELALSELNAAYDQDSQWLAWLNNDRIFDPIRDKPEFVELLNKLGFKTN